MNKNNNPSIQCELCGGRYRKYLKKKHYETNLHKEAENRQYLEINTEESLQLYEKNKEIEKLKEIIFNKNIINAIMSNK